MTELVFDANVPWDLDKINKLDEIMQILHDNFRISMSDKNFKEMPYYIQNKTSKYIMIQEINDDGEFDEFKKDIRNNSITLDNNDSTVLFISHKVDADFIVSSDTEVIKKAKQFVHDYNKKAKSYHILDMLRHLCDYQLIESDLCMKMALKLYKNKEIPHMIKTHGNELIVNNTKRTKWIEINTETCVDTFNIYNQHIVSLK